MERNTSQKQIVLDYLQGVTSHPSVEVIYRAVKDKLPRISLGTVYRILKNLKDKDEILEIPAEVARYDANVSQHAHFVCEKCARIFDVFDNLGKLNFNRQKVGKINKYQVYLYGSCKKCK